MTETYFTVAQDFYDIPCAHEWDVDLVQASDDAVSRAEDDGEEYFIYRVTVTKIRKTRNNVTIENLYETT